MRLHGTAFPGEFTGVQINGKRTNTFTLSHEGAAAPDSPTHCEGATIDG